MMRESTLNLTPAENTDIVNPNDYFFYSEKNKTKRCRVGIMKCCGIMIALLGVNALSFYVGYLVSKGNDDGSGLL